MGEIADDLIADGLDRYWGCEGDDGWEGEYDDYHAPRAPVYVTFPVRVIGETPKAWKVVAEAMPFPEWFPKSRCSLKRENSLSPEGVLTIPGWLALRKEGLKVNLCQVL